MAIHLCLFQMQHGGEGTCHNIDSLTDYTKSDEGRAVRYAHVTRQCIRKEHYPPDIARTSQERQVDAESYVATVTKLEWDQDMDRFLRYGSCAEMLHKTGFYKLGLAEQKAWVYTHQRTTECERMDREFENEVLAKIKTMDAEMADRKQCGIASP
jgi:hypothetical protein